MSCHFQRTEIQHLRQMRRDGFTTKKIAKKLKRTKASVEMAVRKYVPISEKRPQTNWTPERIERLGALEKSGCARADMAREFGISDAALKNAMARFGLLESRQNYKSWTDADVRLLKKMIAAGAPSSEFRRGLKRPMRNIQSKIYALGLVRGKTRGWTQQEIDYTLEARADGVPAKVIALKLGRTKTSIYNQHFKHKPNPSRNLEASND